MCIDNIQSMITRRLLSMRLLFCARPYQDIDFSHIRAIAFSQLVWLVLISLTSITTQVCCCLLSSSGLTQGLGELDDVIVVRLVSLGLLLGGYWAASEASGSWATSRWVTWECGYLSVLSSCPHNRISPPSSASVLMACTTTAQWHSWLLRPFLWHQFWEDKNLICLLLAPSWQKLSFFF